MMQRVHRRRWALGLIVILILVGVVWWKNVDQHRSRVTATPATPNHSTTRLSLGSSGPVLSTLQSKPSPTKRSIIEGKVVADDGVTPVERAEVSFDSSGARLAAITNAAGDFSLSAEPGVLTLESISARGYRPFTPSSRIQVRIQAQQLVSGLLFELEPVKQVVVKVFDIMKRTIGNSRVVCLGPDATSVAFPREATTSADGEASIEVGAGDSLEVSRDGYLSKTYSVTSDDVSDGEIDILLDVSTPNAQQVKGVVVTSTGQPVEGCKVTLAMEKSAERVYNIFSSVDGRFEFPAVAAASYIVIGQHQSYGIAQMKVQDRGDIRLVLPAGCALRGVVHADLPVTQFTVLQRTMSGAAVPANATFYDSGGNFEILSGAGSVSLQVVAPGFAPSQTQVVSIPNDCSMPPLDIRMTRGGAVVGRVIDSASREGLKATVSINGLIDQTESPLPISSLIETDADGAFTVEGIAPGHRSILATAALHHGRLLNVLVADAQRSGPFEIALHRTKEGETPRVQMTGIGAQLRPGDSAMIVLQVVPGGGAESAGIVAGDSITAVDGASVASIGFDDAMQRVRGAEDSVVVLRVVHGDAQAADVAVTRKLVQ